LRKDVLKDNKENILIIDDEVSPRESIRMVLKDNYNVSTASGAVEGIAFMEKNPIDLVVLDIMMPGMDGITALREIKKKHPDTEIILLTAYASIKTAKSAVRFGALDYLTKPFDKNDVIKVVRRGLEKKHSKDLMRLEREHLLYRTKDLELQVNDARKNFLVNFEGTLNALIVTIDVKDRYTCSHSEHVAKWSSVISRMLDMTTDEEKKINRAASMHDIGKIGIDGRILKKDGALTPEEFNAMKKHPEIGASIVQQIPFLESAVPVILYHHERYDGTGYPEGLKGEAIPLNARIVMIADAIDSMMHARPYRNSLPIETVLSELEGNVGTQFDPEIVTLILKKKILQM
jgi:response regulator RpfG family c-di-GMP phosphodiesterase